jgi:hypothetical protein
MLVKGCQECTIFHIMHVEIHNGGEKADAFVRGKSLPQKAASL